MENEGTKTLLMLVVVAVVLIAAAFAVRAIMTWQNDSQQPQLAGSVSASDNGEPTNIKSSAPTPGSCTKEQNCGSPTCGASRGAGCGCGG